VLSTLERALEGLRAARAWLALGLCAAAFATFVAALAPLPARARLFVAAAAASAMIWLVTLIAAPSLLLGRHTRAGWWVNAAGLLAGLLAGLGLPWILLG
jgi:hypothetical protein